MRALVRRATEGSDNERLSKKSDEDEVNKQKIEAKNGLENYCSVVRHTL